MSVQKAIDFFGTQKALAKACGVRQQAVSAWVRGINNPSVRVSREIERLTNGAVTKEQLRPDVYK